MQHKSILPLKEWCLTQKNNMAGFCFIPLRLFDPAHSHHQHALCYYAHHSWRPLHLLSFSGPTAGWLHAQFQDSLWINVPPIQRDACNKKNQPNVWKKAGSDRLKRWIKLLKECLLSMLQRAKASGNLSGSEGKRNNRCLWLWGCTSGCLRGRTKVSVHGTKCL